jgi:hypothetical protein
LKDNGWEQKFLAMEVLSSAGLPQVFNSFGFPSSSCFLFVDGFVSPDWIFRGF